MADNNDMSQRIGRIGGVALLVLAIAFGIGGSQIKYAFSSDPLGPRAVPVMLATILALLCLFYLRKPGPAEDFPKGRLLLKILAVPTLMLVSVLLLDPLGFAASILVLTTGVGLVFGAPPLLAIVGGIGQALLWWFVFAYLLDVYLPSGQLFG